MGDADHRCLGARTVGAAVTGQALVAVLIDVITANAVGNGRRLLGIIALTLEVLVLVFGNRRGR
ncbi:hypothetical protein D3C71_2221300 [compost metagenome]